MISKINVIFLQASWKTDKPVYQCTAPEKETLPTHVNES